MKTNKTNTQYLTIYSTTGEFFPANVTVIQSGLLPEDSLYAEQGYEEFFDIQYSEDSIIQVFDQFKLEYYEILTSALKFHGLGDDTYYDYFPDFMDMLYQVILAYCYAFHHEDIDTCKKAFYLESKRWDEQISLFVPGYREDSDKPLPTPDFDYYAKLLDITFE